MAVDASGLIWAHPGLDPVELFESEIVLAVVFPGCVVVLDEGLEVHDACLFLPAAGLDVPVEPLDQVVCLPALLDGVEDLLDLVVLALLVDTTTILHLILPAKLIPVHPSKTE